MVGSVIVSSDAEFEASVQQATEPLVLLYFWAPWCGPCRLMSPSVEWAAQQYGDRLRVLKFEVDPNPNVVAKYGVQGVPALILLKNNEVIAQSEGALTKQRLIDFLTPHLPA